MGRSPDAQFAINSGVTSLIIELRPRPCGRIQFQLHRFVFIDGVLGANQFLEITMAYPPEFKYTKEHEWLAVDGTTGTIGITDYAQNSLGDIVFVELPKVGAELAAGKTFGTVESVKAVSDLYAPVSGTVTAINESSPPRPRRSTAIPTPPGW